MRERPGDDTDLLERLRAGEPRAFEDLVRSYQHRVFGVAFRMLQSPAEAEDIAQEVFLRVHRAIGAFRGDAKLSTWLYGIASNLCLSGATYGNAALKLVAGDVNRARDPRPSPRMMEIAAKAASPDAARRDFASEGFFEYHLYTLDGRTTIKDNQTKQLSLMSAAEVPIRKHLVY